jgi:hypothetical protein
MDLFLPSRGISIKQNMEKRRTSEGCDFTPYIYCIIMFKKWLIYGEILGDTPCLSVLVAGDL